MASIKRHKVLYDSAAAGSGEWFRLDSRYDEALERALQIKMNASDTVAIEATTIDAIDAARLAAVIDEDEDVVTLESYTGATDVDGVLSGNWTYIRVTKTGTAGHAKVQGYI